MAVSAAVTEVREMVRPIRFGGSVGYSTCLGCRSVIGRCATCDGIGHLTPGKSCSNENCRGGADSADHAEGCPRRNVAVFPALCGKQWHATNDRLVGTMLDRNPYREVVRTIAVRRG